MSESCDRCGRYGDDLEETLAGDVICAKCRRQKRGEARSRDVDQHDLDSFAGGQDV